MFKNNFFAIGDVGTPSTPINPATPSTSSSGLTSFVMSSEGNAKFFGSATPVQSVMGGMMREYSGVFDFFEEGEEGGEGDEPRAEEEISEETESSVNEDELVQNFASKNLFAPTTPATVPSFVDKNTDKTTEAIEENEKTELVLLQEKFGATAPRISNIAGLAELGCKLDLKKIAMTARNTEYNPRRFPAVIIRIRLPDPEKKATGLVFSTGMMMVVGSKSYEESHFAAMKLGRMIKKIGYPEVRLKRFRIVNIQCSFTVSHPVHLEKMNMGVPMSRFNPEIHPALFCYIPGLPSLPGEKKRSGVVLVYSNGKCVLLGVRNDEEILIAYRFILPILHKYAVVRKRSL